MFVPDISITNGEPNGVASGILSGSDWNLVFVKYDWVFPKVMIILFLGSGTKNAVDFVGPPHTSSQYETVTFLHIDLPAAVTRVQFTINLGVVVNEGIG